MNDVDSGGIQQLVDVWRLVGTPTTLPVGTNFFPSVTISSAKKYATISLSVRVVYIQTFIEVLTNCSIVKLSTCAEFYYGTVCENLNECLSQSINCTQGVCVDGDGAGTCTCNPGYTGQFCDESIDYCLNVNCSGNRQCQNFVDSFKCNCTPGFTDRDCETDIDDCVGVTCNGRGNCTDLVNDYLCTCDPGYTDRDCETDINECVGVNCSGNGQCVDEVNSYSCSCDPGYTGGLCKTNVDDCVGVNCSGNGQCVDGENNFTCLCQPGFIGDLCNEGTLIS